MYEESVLSTIEALRQDGVLVDKVSLPLHYGLLTLPVGVASGKSKDGLIRFYSGSTIVLVQTAHA